MSTARQSVFHGAGQCEHLNVFFSSISDEESTVTGSEVPENEVNPLPSSSGDAAISPLHDHQ